MTLVRGAIYGLFLAAILIVGLYAVPLAIATGGVVAPAGSEYSISIGSSETIQFSTGHPSRMTGSLVSSSVISVYIMNLSQFYMFQPDAYPQDTTYSLGNASSFSIDATLPESGVYYLVFYSGSTFYFQSPPIYIQVTSALIVQPV